MEVQADRDSERPFVNESIPSANEPFGGQFRRRGLLVAMAAVGGAGLAACAPSSGSGAASEASDSSVAGRTTDGLPDLAPNSVVDAFARQRAVPVLRDSSAEAARRTAETWAEAGATTVELTTSVPDVFSLVPRLVSQGLTVGVGTMRTAEQVTRAAEAGATFVLSFATFPELISTAVERGITPIPGTMTPTEIFNSLAAPMIKVFPASVLGPDYQADLSVLFPGIRTVATGGITSDPADSRAWLAAGATAVGPAGDLFGDPNEEPAPRVRRRIEAYLAALRG